MEITTRSTMLCCSTGLRGREEDEASRSSTQVDLLSLKKDNNPDDIARKNVTVKSLCPDDTRATSTAS